MVNILSVLGVLFTVTGIFVSILFYIDQNRPTATEVTQALKQRYSGENRNVRGGFHAVTVVKSTVTKSDDWLNEYDNADTKRGTAWITGTFVGSAEIILKFHTPNEPPTIAQIKSHPYYGKEVKFNDERAGAGPFRIEATKESLIVNCGMYCQTSSKGAAAVTGVLIIISRIVDDILTGKIESEDIKSFSEFLDEERLLDVAEPVTTIDDVPDMSDY